MTMRRMATNVHFLCRRRRFCLSRKGLRPAAWRRLPRRRRTLAEHTFSQQAAGAETSKQLRQAPRVRSLQEEENACRRRWPGIAGAGGLLLLAMISVRTSSGTLEIEIDDPNVQVAVKQGGEVVEVVDAKSGWKISLKSGQYELASQGSNDKFQLDPRLVTVKRGDVVKVKVTLKRQEPPLPLSRRGGREGGWPSSAPSLPSTRRKRKSTRKRGQSISACRLRSPTPSA